MAKALFNPATRAREAGQATASTQALLTVTVFLLIFIMAARTPLDSDLWWHLRAGQETLSAGHPILTDVASFTRFGAHWINHSWLSQVGMALLFNMGGYLALGAAMALLATLSMALVYLQCEGPAWLKGLALLLGCVVASTVWVARPQLASLVLLALVGYLLFLYKRRGKDRLWLLPPVFLFWSNLHGGYALGLILIGSFLAGEAFNHLLAIRSETVLSWRQIARVGGWAVAAALAVLINPNGLDIWRIPFQTINVGVLQQFISEWASPDFHNLLHQSLLWLVFALLAALALSRQVADGSDLVVALVFGWMAFTARRNYGPFAIVAVPPLTRYAACALDQWQERLAAVSWTSRLSMSASRPAITTTRSRPALNLAIASLLFLVGFIKLFVVTQPQVVVNIIDQQYPTRAVAWLALHRPDARLFNEYDWGGYIQWKLPLSRVFVDGRTDLFGDEILGEWMTTVDAGEGWEQVLSRYPVDFVMLAPDRPLLRELRLKGWKLAYADDQAVIYAPPPTQ